MFQQVAEVIQGLLARIVRLKILVANSSVLQRRLVENRRAIRCDTGESEENDTGKGKIRRTSPSSV